jgi:hypothetical protein
MDAEIKRKWVEALRSGEYRQSRSLLRRGNAFCCLGVLCDLVANQVDGEWRHNDFVLGDSQVFGMPPEEVRTFAGMTRDAENFVANMNDGGKSFAEIADYIERHL